MRTPCELRSHLEFLKNLKIGVKQQCMISHNIYISKHLIGITIILNGDINEKHQNLGKWKYSDCFTQKKKVMVANGT